jgi:hypothetical protein
MQAVRKLVPRESIPTVFIPEEFGDMVELIVLPLKRETTMPRDSEAVLQLQAKTGFAMTVLADPQEDVWNERILGHHTGYPQVEAVNGIMSPD